MDLLNKALELCAEIEQRQTELRAILAQLKETAATDHRDAACFDQPAEAPKMSEEASAETDQSESSDATCCVRTPETYQTSEEEPAESDSSDQSDHPTPAAPAAPPAPPAPPAPAEKPAGLDLRKAFTINDRFRFRRELFGGDDKAFVAAIDRMSQCSDYSEVEAFISTLGWKSDNDDAVAFKEIISTFYNGYHL